MIELESSLIELRVLLLDWRTLLFNFSLNKLDSALIELKSVRNCRRVVEVFGGVFVLSPCFLDFFVGVGSFVIGLSQISSYYYMCAIRESSSSNWIRELKFS